MWAAFRPGLAEPGRRFIPEWTGIRISAKPSGASAGGLAGDLGDAGQADDRSVTAVHIPGIDSSQPTGFLNLLARAMEPCGIHSSTTSRLKVRWALRASVDVVHLHWLEYIVDFEPSGGMGTPRTLARIAGLLIALIVLRVRQIRVVWTVHNLARHEPVRPRLEQMTARITYLVANEVIVHSEYARDQVRHRYGARRRLPHVIPHANYVGVYPASSGDRSEVRQRLGLPEAAYVFLAFGQIRPYKRLDVLAERFSRLPDVDARLVIAGRPPAHDTAEQLRALAGSDSRIILRFGFVPDKMVADLHTASDVAVFAYRDVFSSGALLLALSQSVPAVVPAAGTAAELFSGPAVEFFENDEDLTAAMSRIRDGDPVTRATAALDAAAAFPWSVAGARTAHVYRNAGPEGAAGRSSRKN